MAPKTLEVEHINLLELTQRPSVQNGDINDCCRGGLQAQTVEDRRGLSTLQLYMKYGNMDLEEKIAKTL